MSQFDTLLDVQRHDTTLDQLRHRLATLPERSALAGVEEQLSSVAAEAAEVTERRDEVARRQKQLEDEMATLEAKISDLDKKLYSGTVSAIKELQAIQADIDSLKRHDSDLEDRVLALMEEREPLDQTLAGLSARTAELDAEAMRLRAAIAEAETAIGTEIEGEEARRQAAAATLPEEMLKVYEQMRRELGGVAIAVLEAGGRCGGCHLTLPASEVARIKREPLDALIRCDQCGRILLRPEAVGPA